MLLGNTFQKTQICKIRGTYLKCKNNADDEQRAWKNYLNAWEGKFENDNKRTEVIGAQE